MSYLRGTLIQTGPKLHVAKIFPDLALLPVLVTGRLSPKINSFLIIADSYVLTHLA